MGIRDILNQNSSLGILAAVVLLVVSLFFIYRQLTGGGAPSAVTSLYYYDLNTGTIIEGAVDAIPPIVTDSGPFEGEPAGVRALIFACGECDRSYEGMTPTEVAAEGAELAYLQKYPLDVKARIEEAQQNSEYFDYGDDQEHLYREVNGARWLDVFDDSEQVNQVVTSQLQCPAGEFPKVCLPGRR